MTNTSLDSALSALQSYALQHDTRKRDVQGSYNPYRLTTNFTVINITDCWPSIQRFFGFIPASQKIENVAAVYADAINDQNNVWEGKDIEVLSDAHHGLLTLKGKCKDSEQITKLNSALGRIEDVINQFIEKEGTKPKEADKKTVSFATYSQVQELSDKEYEKIAPNGEVLASEYRAKLKPPFQKRVPEPRISIEPIQKTEKEVQPKRKTSRRLSTQIQQPGLPFVATTLSSSKTEKKSEVKERIEGESELRRKIAGQQGPHYLDIRETTRAVKLSALTPEEKRKIEAYVKEEYGKGSAYAPTIYWRDERIDVLNSGLSDGVVKPVAKLPYAQLLQQITKVRVCGVLEESSIFRERANRLVEVN